LIPHGTTGIVAHYTTADGEKLTEFKVQESSVADVPKPESKVDVDPNFEKRLRDLKDSAASAAEALVEGGR
jgi:hypothetical protein